VYYFRVQVQPVPHQLQAQRVDEEEEKVEELVQQEVKESKERCVVLAQCAVDELELRRKLLKAQCQTEQTLLSDLRLQVERKQVDLHRDSDDLKQVQQHLVIQKDEELKLSKNVTELKTLAQSLMQEVKELECVKKPRLLAVCRRQRKIWSFSSCSMLKRQ